MQRIGRYEIRRSLGQGGFGRLYEAFDPKVNRIVAIKTLNEAGAPDLLLRFRNEAATAGQLHHPNIVTIFDYGEHAGSPYLVMELLNGEDLQSVIAKRRDLSIYYKMRILYEAADGLQHAHSCGIVHRDIKPANIMLLADRHAKLLDFGIALIAHAAMARVTPPGNLIGTYRYMAPEQFRGASPDAQADIFAFGLVCYELLTGAYPFEAADPAAVMYRILNQDPAPFAQYAADFPEGLESVVLRALAKSAEFRYPSMDHLKFDLEPFLLDLKKQRAAAVLDEAKKYFSSGEIASAQLLVRQALELDRGSHAARALHDQIEQAMRRRTTGPSATELVGMVSAHRSPPPEVHPAAPTKLVAAPAPKSPTQWPIVWQGRPYRWAALAAVLVAALAALPAVLSRTTSEPPQAAPAAAVRQPAAEPAPLPPSPVPDWIEAAHAAPVTTSQRPPAPPKQAPVRSSAVEVIASPAPSLPEAPPASLPTIAMALPEPSLATPAAQEPPAPATEGPQQKPESADRAEVLELLKKFEQAIEARNLKKLQAAWPEMPRSVLDSFRKAFRDDRVNYSVRLKALGDSVKGGDAPAIDCERTANTMVGNASTPDQVTRVRVFLARTSDSWVIRGMQDLR